MGSEYMGPFPQPDSMQKQHNTQKDASSVVLPPAEQSQSPQVSRTSDKDELHPGLPATSLPQHRYDGGTMPQVTSETPLNGEPAYREHVSTPLPPPYPVYYYQPAVPSQPPGQGHTTPAGQGSQVQIQQVPPQYGPYPGYSWGYYGQPHAYNGYGYPPYVYPYQYPYQYPYPYPWQPQPKRDTYLLVISIISFIGSGLSLLAGLGFAMLLALFVVLPDSGTLQAGQRFGGMAMVGALAIAGLVGGGFSCYHSVRALFFRKPSAEFKLPWFWIFLALYGIVLVLASTLTINGLAVASVPGALLLIGLAGILPALTFLALGTRRVHYPQKARWPTTWRRFTLALVSGTTSAILLATIFELVLTFILTIGLRLTPFNLSDPNLPVPRDGGALAFLLILVAVIAPLVEESVKPLAVIALIGRIQSAAEAFVLGLACGIGFDLVETTGYISQGYNNWLTVAIQRSTAGLLHGFGAAMVALGWYYLTHRDSINHRILIGLGCIAYAILQHAIWNGSFVLQLLPAPIGPFLESGKIQLGSISFEAFLLVYLCESLLMLVFFLFVTGKLRGRAGQPARPSQLFRPLQKLSLTSKIS